MIYIQAAEDKGTIRPHHFDCSCAMYGAIELAQDYQLAVFEEMMLGKFDAKIKWNLFIGSTEFMREVFRHIGKTDVRLPANSDREHEIITLAEARKRVAEGGNIFIKPVEIKLFTGFILDTMQYSCLRGLPDDTKVMAYEPFPEKIISEWRIYVHQHKAIDSRNYSGNFRREPNYDYADHLINQNRKNLFPSAYTIDLAVLQSGQSVVVEYNDMWAIGNYGIPNDLYLRMLSDRYFEIVRA